MHCEGNLYLQRDVLSVVNRNYDRGGRNGGYGNGMLL